MYWFKLTNTVTGNLDLDIIPVIVGGSPCMYDRVSGNVLPRKGTAGGAFIAGRERSSPDVNFPLPSPLRRRAASARCRPK